VPLNPHSQQASAHTCTQHKNACTHANSKNCSHSHTRALACTHAHTHTLLMSTTTQAHARMYIHTSNHAHTNTSTSNSTNAHMHARVPPCKVGKKSLGKALDDPPVVMIALLVGIEICKPAMPTSSPRDTLQGILCKGIMLSSPENRGRSLPAKRRK
jgi:hypothetical protein